tara:strand:- start:206 stop:694 length:489 start_codon:yes stop_codon:yes gene_type:complete
MSLVTLTTFIVVTTAGGNDPENLNPNRFQNGKYDTPITHPETNKDHEYLSFVYQGAARNRSGDNMECTLILSNNAISMGYAKKAVDGKYHVQVDTYLMNADFTTDKLLTSETWLATSLGYDPTTIEILLSSAIDAVGANAPNRILTSRQVSHLPVTGSIQAR